MSLRKHAIARATIALLLLLTLPACNSETGTAHQQASFQEQGLATDTIQRVNGVAITRGDLNRAVTAILVREQGPKLPTPEVVQQAHQAAINHLISAELLYQAAGQREIKDLDKQVAYRIAQYRAEQKDEADFQEALKKGGLSLQALQESARREIVINDFIEKRFASKATTSEAEAKRFYDDNRGKFKLGNTIRVSHILIGSSRGSSAEERKRAKAESVALLKRVREGENFGILARQYSACPSKVRGGDLGVLGLGEMDTSFERAAMALKLGEISDIVETPLGLHIIKLTEKHAPRTEPYDRAKPRILLHLKREKIDKLLAEYVVELRAKAKIEKL